MGRTTGRACVLFLGTTLGKGETTNWAAGTQTERLLRHVCMHRLENASTAFSFIFAQNPSSPLVLNKAPASRSICPTQPDIPCSFKTFKKI